MNKTQKALLAAVILLGIIVMAVFGNSYLSARRELSALKKELNESTAVWKRINEEKLVVQKELKEAKNDLRDAELTVSESEERAASLESDIEALEKEISELKLKLGSAD